MDDELLIALVRSHPAFYDVSHPGYNDNGYKYRVWNEIATELNADVSACKARWNNLRDNYRKSLKKNLFRCAQSKKTKLYKYADQLSFLDDCFEERRAKGMPGSPKEEDYIHDVEEQEIEEEEVEKKPDCAESVTGTGFNESFQCQSPSTIVMPDAKNDSAGLPKIGAGYGKRKLSPRKVSYSKTPNFSERPVEYRFEEQDKHSPHPVDAFLAGIAPTLKTFTPYYLNLAKSEIFSAVQKYEMRMLEQQLAYGKPGSSYIHDISIIAPSTSHSDSTSSPKESYED